MMMNTSAPDTEPNTDNDDVQENTAEVADEDNKKSTSSNAKGKKEKVEKTEKPEKKKKETKAKASKEPKDKKGRGAGAKEKAKDKDSDELEKPKVKKKLKTAKAIDKTQAKRLVKPKKVVKKKTTRKVVKAVVPEIKPRNIGVEVVPPTEVCQDPDCPFHGTLAVRGQIINAIVINSRMDKTAIVQREIKRYIPKFERYEKRTHKYAVHNPKCVNAQRGDMVRIMECRPLSKSKSFVVIEKM
jgi:small subunit ribosomal protein S17